MCVIIYKPAGAEIPAKELLDKAYKRNPHGCGLVSPSVSYKGLSYALFESKLKRCKKEEPLLIHFRLATHGSVRRKNCHPFLDKTTSTYFMHNGVMGWASPNKDETDSEWVFRKYLQPCITLHGIESEELKRLSSNIMGGSRFAFMQGDKVLLLGDYTERNGLYFSNLRFL